MTNEEMELVGSARANLDNLAGQVPGLSSHPFFKIVTMQLDEALGEPSEDSK